MPIQAISSASWTARRRGVPLPIANQALHGRLTAARWQEGSTDTEIIIFNLATGQWRQITSGEVSEWIQKLSWSPTGDSIVYSAETPESGSSDIFVINTAGNSR